MADELPGGASPDTLIAPSLPRRMACWLYEGMLLFAVVFVAGWLFSTLGQMRDSMDARRPLLQAFLFVVFGVYFAWFWAKGQTLAMKTWNIRVVDREGRPLTQGRALLRYACSWLWFLPPLARHRAFQAWRRAKPGAGAGLGCRVGSAEPFPPAAPVLARRARRDPAHTFRAAEPLTAISSFP